MKLSTRAKLILSSSVTLALIFIFAISAYVSISKINVMHQEINIVNEMTRSLTQLRSDENRLTVLAYEYFVTKDVVRKDSVLIGIKFRSAAIDSLIIQIENSLVIFPKQLVLFRSITAQIGEFRKERGIFFKLVNQGKPEEALNSMTTIQYPIYEKIRFDMIKLEKELDKISSQHDEENILVTKTVDSTLLFTGIGIIMFTILVLVSTLRMLRQIASEMRNGVNVLGTSAAEILNTVTEISTGATETATSVSETTTTVEEIRQTAMVSNQKAQSLIHSSQKAADSVDKGRESINEVIDSIKKIENQMSLISETVLKLADQNRTIGEITSSVSDLADQSNLLAVNAAIEAAKAGEHGRGFTVVAQEIRSLADQSKRSTVQIKEIINEINKSVNQAVGVTDQGVKTVEEGRKLAALSGEVIEILAENVEETTQASIQISSSNQQQMAGMDQIVPAMENIKLASEQNLAGIKQTQAAAHDLNSLGHNLKDIIEKFNL